MKLKSLLLAFLFGSTVLVILPLLAVIANNVLGLYIFSNPVLDYLSLFFLAVGVMLHLPSVYFFKVVGKGTPVPIEPPKHLVRSGWYKFTRNPMYLGLFSLLLGEFFFFGHILLLAYAGLFLVGIHFYVVNVEEPRLRRRFGNDYIDYMNSVPRWVPEV